MLWQLFEISGGRRSLSEAEINFWFVLLSALLGFCGKIESEFFKNFGNFKCQSEAPTEKG